MARHQVAVCLLARSFRQFDQGIIRAVSQECDTSALPPALDRPIRFAGYVRQVFGQIADLEADMVQPFAALAQCLGKRAIPQRFDELNYGVAGSQVGQPDNPIGPYLVVDQPKAEGGHVITEGRVNASHQYSYVVDASNRHHRPPLVDRSTNTTIWQPERKTPVAKHCAKATRPRSWQPFAVRSEGFRNDDVDCGSSAKDDRQRSSEGDGTISEPSAPSFDLKPLEVERREATTTEIARRLLRYLLSGAFEPGHRLPSERTLASELAVGRSVIREALKSLVLLGIVEVRQGDGTFLRSAESDLLPNVIEWGLLLGTRSTRDLIEIRRYMEVLTAGLAAERRDERALEKMWSELDAMYAASNPTAFVAADIGFHLAIAAAAGNGVLLQIMTSVRTLLRVWITKNVENLDDTKSIADEHKPVVEAIQAGDPAQARSAMQAHMDAALARLDGTLADAGKA